MNSSPPIPIDEAARLAELEELELMYSEPEAVFDRVTAGLSEIFDAPAVMMNLIDRDNQYVKSAAGVAGMVFPSIIPRKDSLCGYVVGSDQVMVVEDLALDERFRDNAIVKEKGLRFYAGAPLRTQNGQPIGALCVVDVKPRVISHREQMLLKMVADALMTEVKLRRTSRQLLERSRIIERDLASARAVQRFLLPPQKQEGNGYSFWYYYHPFDAIGGDFLDTRVRPDGSLATLLADVSGHGASAALTSAMVKTIFQHAAGITAGPAQLLTRIQCELSRAMDSGQFVTAAAAVFDPANRVAQLSSAGHPFPILLRGRQAEIVPTVNNLPMLIEPQQDYAGQTTLNLRGGDRLLFYTDGASEAADPAGEMLGTPGLLPMIESNAALSGGEFLDSLFGAIRGYANGRLRDDVALVCLEVK